VERGKARDKTKMPSREKPAKISRSTETNNMKPTGENETSPEVCKPGT